MTDRLSLSLSKGPIRTMRGHSFFDHTADLGIAFWGDEPADLLRAGAGALWEATFGSVPWPEPTPANHHWVAPQPESEWATFDWLKHWLSTFHCERVALIPGRFRVLHPGNPWNLEVDSAGWDVSEMAALREIKAITLHRFRVWHEEALFRAEVIVDI